VPDSDHDDVVIRTRDALLEHIYDQVQRAPNASALLRLAEAYAWAVAPDQAHGGTTEG
jgi:hypothetical protein